MKKIADSDRIYSDLTRIYLSWGWGGGGGADKKWNVPFTKAFKKMFQTDAACR